MIRSYFNIAWRNLKKNKLFTVVNIFGLTAGLASCMLICLYIYDEFSYDTHHPNVERLYQVATIFKQADEDHKSAGTNYGTVEAMKDEFPEIESFTRFVSLFVDDKTMIEYTNGQERIIHYENKGYLADERFFDFFQYDFIEGSPDFALERPNSIVISKEIAERFFGSEPALGKTLHVESNTNGNDDFEVTGVYKPSKTPSHIDAKFLISYKGGSLANYISGQQGLANNNMFYSYLKLAPGTDVSKLESKFPSFVDKYMGEDLRASGFGKEQFLIPVKGIHFYSEIPENVSSSSNTKYIYILFSIAIFTLLIACINYMNLSTARSSKRSNEVGIRKVMGAEKGSLIRQFLSESIILSIVALTLAGIIVIISLPAFEDISGKSFNYSLAQYISLGAVFLSISLLAGLVAGSYPAFYLSSFNPIKVLKGKFKNSMAATNLRKAMVVTQFTVAMILIVASVVIFNQMAYLKTTDLGFKKDQQVVLPLRSQESKKNYKALLNELENSASVVSAAGSSYYPGIFDPEDTVYRREGQIAQQGQSVTLNRVDYGFLKTLNIELIAGRTFNPQFSDSTSIIINEKAVKDFSFTSVEDAIGKRLFSEWNGQVYYADIVGVVKDFHYQDFKNPILPFGFTLNRGNYNYVIAHLSSEEVGKSLTDIQSIWSKVNSSEPLEFTFLDEDFQKNYEAESRLYAIVGYFTLIAIIISCLGLFGLVTFSADQRVKEIGVRKVLGASVTNIINMLSIEFLKLVGIAILIAIPIGYWAMSKWLQEFEYKINLGWWMFVLAAFLALAIALLTVSSQALKAAITNPIKSLRTE